jgi:hypothetical protein
MFYLPLAFPASHNQQHDAAHERNSPQNGRQRNRFSFLSRHLDGAKIDDFFPGRVGDALVSERRDSQHDQYDCNDDICFDKTSRFLKSPSSPLPQY